MISGDAEMMLVSILSLSTEFARPAIRVKDDLMIWRSYRESLPILRIDFRKLLVDDPLNLVSTHSFTSLGRAEPPLSAPAISMRQSEVFGPSRKPGNAQRSTLSLLRKSYAITEGRWITSRLQSPLYLAMSRHTSKQG
jgi:hypothetical protein